MTRPWWPLAVVALLVAACSALVDPWSEALKCDTEAAQPCPNGLSCIEGVCQTGGELPACEPAARELCDNQRDDDCDGLVDEGMEEVCNGIDDDCDGDIDNGHDRDNDGFTWCGSGDPTALDCEDDDATIFPDATELCDGLDNNCNDVIDEDPPDGGSLCANGQVCASNRCMDPDCTPGSCLGGERCDVESGECVAAGCMPENCEAGKVCDSVSGECTEARDNGQECVLDTDCKSGLCIDALALRLQLSERVCGQSCCADSDCPGAERCYASGSGARSCLPPELDPRVEPLTACTVDAQCGSDETCAAIDGQELSTMFATDRSDLVAPQCATTLPIEPAGGSCSFISEVCTSRVCTPHPDGFLSGFCTSMCRNSADCAYLPETLAVTDAFYCRFARIAGPTQDDYVPVCVASFRGETGAGLPGSSCSNNSDCTDGACVRVGDDGICAPPCCSDEQCTDLPGTRCRPVTFGNRHEMRCVP